VACPEENKQKEKTNNSSHLINLSLDQSTQHPRWNANESTIHKEPSPMQFQQLLLSKPEVPSIGRSNHLL
jgi:hypothetical protein